MNLLDRHRDLGLLILRVGFGLSYIYFHGSYKITGGPEFWAGNGEVMARLGITFGYTFWGFANMLAETLGALMIALGLFFRPVAAVLVFNMAMATLAHVASGQGNPAQAIKGTVFFLGVFLTGPGKYSADAWLAKRRR